MKFLERQSPPLLNVLFRELRQRRLLITADRASSRPFGIYLYQSLQFGFGIAAGAILRLVSPQKDIFGPSERVW